MPLFARSLPAEATNIAPLRRELGRWAGAQGVDAKLVAAVELAVSEALTNVVMHAYVAGPPGTMQLRADAGEDGLDVVITDTGRGFGPRSDSPGAGFGISIMRALASQLQIGPAAGTGTSLHLRFEPDGRSPSSGRKGFP